MTEFNQKLFFYDIVQSPVLTEKSNMMSEKRQYFFRVLNSATKPQISKAISSMFSVEVSKVNTLVRKGKSKIFKGRKGKTQDSKIAIVTLVDGQRIDIAGGLV